MTNPLLSDRDVDFLLYDVLDVGALTKYPYFADHDRQTFELFLQNARKFAREKLYPTYKSMDEQPPKFIDGKVFVHPKMKEHYPGMVELGMTCATRPVEVGGQQLPLTISTVASAYLMAGNLSAYAYVGLTSGAAHLLEAFGTEELRREYMAPAYDGRFTGTMALTEPQAGSSLADVTSRAVKNNDGSYSITGSKIFISGGDHDLTENIIHMTLARIDGAPAGIKGVSLFCVPKKRLENGALVDNDVQVAGVIHKIGWKGLPSLALSYGDRGDCKGWLVGEPNKGISYMFQMMNEARIMVGVNGVATSAVAYQESLAYAAVRTQGRPISSKTSAAAPVPIIEHADVRRMLLRQKAIVEGGLALVAKTAYYADLAEHADNEALRARSKMLLDLLTPVAKSFPAERGFEANALSLQIHGGYGYSSEYLPESWLRDQKLNTIHEGTTGIQALDLLGRKAIAQGGAALGAFREELTASTEAAKAAGLPDLWTRSLDAALIELETTTFYLGAKGLEGDAEGMLLHAADYLDLFGTLVVAWMHLVMATASRKKTPSGEEEAAFLRGKFRAAEYWINTEVPRIALLAALCRSGEESYLRVRPDEL